jgi:Domain of unknown function (DUF1840)
MRRRVDAVALAVATRGASHSLANKGQHKGRDLAMWITFKTRAAPDVQMLDNLADYLLAIIGKRLGERGVIMHDELPVAIQKLESAIAVDKQERAEHDGHFHEGEPGHEPHEIPAGLAQRAYPFLDMLRLAHKANGDILWGV